MACEVGSLKLPRRRRLSGTTSIRSEVKRRCRQVAAAAAVLRTVGRPGRDHPLDIATAHEATGPMGPRLAKDVLREGAVASWPSACSAELESQPMIRHSRVANSRRAEAENPETPRALRFLPNEARITFPASNRSPGQAQPS